MSINLAKLGVPVNGNPANQGLLMPKLQYRYRVNFLNFGVTKATNELTKQIITATRPSPEFDAVVLDAYNSRINIAGKPKWTPISIVVRDDASGAVSRLVGEQLQKQFDFYEQASASAGSEYKFQTHIEILDGGNGAYTPTVLERFELYGCYVNKVEYKGGDYKSSEPLDITLSITYDNALQYNGAEQLNGIGVPVGLPTRQGSQATG
jgi:hypothetical protein